MKRVSTPCGPGLDAGDDALDAVPACGAVVEFLEPAALFAVGRGGARGRAGLQRGDMLAQRGRRGDAEHVIEPLGAAEPQHLRRAVVAVGAQQDLDPRPVGAQRRDQAVQPEDDLASTRPTGGAQQGGDHAALAVEHHDGLEAVFIVVGVEQAKLLAAVHGVERVVDVEHDPARHLAEALAVVLHHGLPHAQQGVPVRQVLRPRHGRLRAQGGIFGQPLHRQLEQRVGAQAVGVVAVLVAGSDHQHAKADDLVETVPDAHRRPRVVDAGGKTPRDPQPPLDLPQHQQAAVGGHQPPVEARLDGPPASG